MSAQPQRDRLVRKIAKLLRIAKADPGPQGRTAKGLADTLMRKHNIKVVLSDLEKSEKDKDAYRALEVSPKPIWWRLILLNDIAPMYSCRGMSTRGQDGEMWFLWVLGKQADIQRCSIHYEWLLSRIRMVEKKAGVHPFVAKDVWREGVCCGALQNFVDRLQHRDRLRNVKIGEPVSATVTIKRDNALVPVVQPDEINLGSDDVGPAVDNKLPTVELNPPQEALESGYRKAELHDPVPPAICFGDVYDLDLVSATERVLRDHGITKVYELMRMRPHQLRSLTGIGQRRYIEILTCLANYGLEMRPDW